jgi:lipopolysaccharide export system permease protein
VRRQGGTPIVMRKIDKLIIGSFIGPFILTFFVVVFILLTQFMLKYFDEIVGKDLDASVIAELIFYFSVFMTPNAFPLAVLLSSLMTFGNLGEHFEMTAIKSAGISMTRTLVPLFVFSAGLTWAAYYSNNNIVPKANLKAFSLLYDVKQKKPSMEIREGAFYNGIDGYSIKVNQKFPDDKTLKEIIIYNHTQGSGNKEVILADSGIMYNVLNGRYLMLELFNGHSYSERRSEDRRSRTGDIAEPFVRNQFDKSKIAFSLASFDLKRTKEDLFANNRLMKNSEQLKVDIDSMHRQYRELVEEIQDNSFQFFDFHLSDLIDFYKKRMADRQERQRQQAIEQGIINNQQMGAVTEMQTADTVGVADGGEGAEATDSTAVPPVRDKLLRRVLMRNMAKNQAAGKNAADSAALAEAGPADSSTVHPRLTLNDSAAGDPVAGVGDSLTDPDTALMPDSAPGPGQDTAEAAGIESLVHQPRESAYIPPADLEQFNARIDSAFANPLVNRHALERSLSLVRRVKNHLMVQTDRLDKLKVETIRYEHEKAKKLSNAFMILVMFLIGAPLGAIIKRGGLGVPVILSVIFFILFYVISMICDKWARRELMDPVLAAWSANIVLLPVGLFFLRQARNDSPLLDIDFYAVHWVKLKNRFHRLLNRWQGES